MIPTPEVDNANAGQVERRSRYAHPPGVYRTSWGNRWFVQFRHRGRRYYLGTFDTEDEAVAARRAALDRLTT